MPAVPNSPSPPQVDLERERRVFAKLEDPMRPRVSENDRAYSSFLLYCMQGERSLRRIAKALKISDGSVRYWKKKFAWDRRRVSSKAPDWEALRAFRMLMDIQSAQALASSLRIALDFVLEESGLSHLRHAVAAQRKGHPAGPAEHDVSPLEKDSTPAPVSGGAAGSHILTPLSDNELSEFDPEDHLRNLRQTVLQNHLRPQDVKRQVQLIDGTLGLIARRVSEGKIEVKVSDIPALLKARALITGMPTDNLAVQANHNHNHTVVLESARLRDARKSGSGAMLGAIKDELEELQVIVAAVPRVIDVTEGS